MVTCILWLKELRYTRLRITRALRPRSVCPI